MNHHQGTERQKITYTLDGTLLTPSARAGSVEPCYARNGITLYQGDCLEVFGLLDPAVRKRIVAVITDPPYGIAYTVTQSWNRPHRAYTNRPIAGDREPFDPTPWLGFPRVVLFGANHFANRLPASSEWIVWDKLLDGQKETQYGSADLIWTNGTGPVRRYVHEWVGFRRGAEHGSHQRRHPTQKPIGLMRWLIERYTRPGDLVIDPYAGSGTTLLAAQDCGREAIGIEIDPGYCASAIDRLGQQPLFGRDRDGWVPEQQ
jgi:hypothetical protein